MGGGGKMLYTVFLSILGVSSSPSVKRVKNALSVMPQKALRQWFA